MANSNKHFAAPHLPINETIVRLESDSNTYSGYGMKKENAADLGSS